MPAALADVERLGMFAFDFRLFWVVRPAALASRFDEQHSGRAAFISEKQTTRLIRSSELCHFDEIGRHAAPGCPVRRTDGSISIPLRHCGLVYLCICLLSFGRRPPSPNPSSHLHSFSATRPCPARCQLPDAIMLFRCFIAVAGSVVALRLLRLFAGVAVIVI